MAVVITVAQQKGGAGKTMLAANLATAFAATGRVALIDIDPQRSLTRWHELRGARANPATVLSFSDMVLIDSPPQIDLDAKLAIRGADLVVVPVQPSPPDIWAAEGTLKLTAAEGRRAILVLNRAPNASRLRDQMEADIARRGLPILAQALGNRTAFASAFAEGLGVVESAPRSLAAQELLMLADQIRAETL
jgi:chromosome partitioning protein